MRIDVIRPEVGNDYGRYIKVIVGNNRMAVAKELGIKEIPIIVNIYDPTFKLEGRELKTDDNLLIMDCNMDNGHGGASGRFERYKRSALTYSFLFDLEGITQ